MYRVSKQFEFCAAHYLPGHGGKCQHRHGHNYKVDVILCCEQLHHNGAQRGMLVDFAYLDLFVNPLLEKLDHQDLNDVLEPIHPTAENIAYWLWFHIESAIEKSAAVFDKGQLDNAVLTIEVWETDSCSASYTGMVDVVQD